MKKEDLTSGDMERVFVVRWLLIIYSSAKPLVLFLGTKYSCIQFSRVVFWTRLMKTRSMRTKWKGLWGNSDIIFTWIDRNWKSISPSTAIRIQRKSYLLRVTFNSWETSTQILPKVKLTTFLRRQILMGTVLFHWIRSYRCWSNTV